MKKIFIVGFKNGKKVCEINITRLLLDEIGLIIELQEIQGRTWRFERRSLPQEKKGKTL